MFKTLLGQNARPAFRILYQRFIFPALIVVIVLDSCSSNRTIIEDNRLFYLHAKEWDPVFQAADSQAGIRVLFTIDSESDTLTDADFDVLSRTTITLYAYPIDTTVIVKEMKNQVMPLPEGGMADIVSICYEIKSSMIQSTIINHGNDFFVYVQPDTYWVQLQTIPFEPVIYEDVIVKSDSLSVLKIILTRRPREIY